MCGRYVSPDIAAIEREWSLSPRSEPLGEYVRSYNVAPDKLAIGPRASRHASLGRPEPEALPPATAEVIP